MLKKRIISSSVIIFFLIGMFLLDKFWLYLILCIITAMGVDEIWFLNKNIHKNKIRFVAFVLTPIIYMAFSVIFIVSKLRWECNIWWIISAVAGASLYDTFAYFVGKCIGKHRIVPIISPGKTWEGTIAGFLGPILVALIVGKYFLNLSYLKISAFALIIGILAFLGDLSVSWYKRKLNVKDTGFIIPGHGGLLDRIDSHMLVIIGVYYFQIFLQAT